MKQGNNGLSKLTPCDLEVLARLKRGMLSAGLGFDGVADLEDAKELLKLSRKQPLRVLHGWGVAAFTLDLINKKILGKEALPPRMAKFNRSTPTLGFDFSLCT